MEQLKQLYARLTVRQRLTLVVAAAAVVAALVGLSRWNHERDFAALFHGLAPDDAGAVVGKLRERAVEFRLAEGGSTVLVPAALVDELRLELAAGGLPRSGRLGFELFDKSNLGATEFAEQVNYHRAVEGELERTMRAIGDIEQARVHLTFPKESLFLEQQKPAKASVLVQLRPGRRLAPAAIQAICHLTASAVQGLTPESVSVVDTQGNLLSRPRQRLPEAEGAGDAVLDYRKGVERDLAAKVHATLEPVLGAEHFRVGVSAEIDLTSGEQSEEVFDPAKSVMVQSQRTEDAPAAGTGSGVPGTASTLPRPAARPGAAGSGYVRRSEGITYQSSRVVKRTRLPQGALKRVSLAVLVDHESQWEGSGEKARRKLTPPTPEKLKVIKDLTAAAVGLQTERGDQLVVESFPFETSAEAGRPAAPVAAPAPPAATFGLTLPGWLGAGGKVLWLGVAGGVLLAMLAAGVWFGARRRRRMSAEEGAKALAAGGAGTKFKSPEELEAAMQAQLAEQKQAVAEKTAEQLMALKLPPAATKKAEVLGKHIAAETKKDPQGMAQIVRSWLSAEES